MPKTEEKRQLASCFLPFLIQETKVDAKAAKLIQEVKVNIIRTARALMRLQKHLEKRK